MRRSRTATATLTGLIGLVAFFGLAGSADAEVNTNASKSLSVAPGGTTGGTTGGMVIANPPKVGPTTTIPEMDIVIPAGPIAPPKGDFDLTAVPEGNVVIDPAGDPNDPCAPLASCPQDGECNPVPGAAADPDCPRPCVPSTTNIPNPDCPPDDDCLPTPGAAADPDCPRPCVPSTTNTPNPDCPPEKDPCDEDDRPQDPPRARANATTGGTTGGATSATTGDRPGGTDGDRPDDCPGTTGGTTGGSDGRLPKTGAELMTYAAAGLGLTGIGFGLKRIGRKAV